MITITADMFSGQPNPKWVLMGEKANKLLEQIVENPSVLDFTGLQYFGLGYRGLIIELMSSDVKKSFNLPTSFRITNATSTGVDISKRIINTISPESITQGYLKPSLKKIRWLKKCLFKENEKAIVKKIWTMRTIRTTSVQVDIKKQLDWATKWKKMGACAHEQVAFDPSFWNDSEYVRLNNNCYNFATNIRTDTFAQPGEASNCPFPYGYINCSSIKSKAISDGVVEVTPCPPSNEQPRHLIALIVKPGPWLDYCEDPEPEPGDYHWYRQCSGGLWAHKMGTAPATNYDGRGNVIYDPASILSGSGYMFCSYLFTQNSMRIK